MTEYYTPTRVFFGKGAEEKLGKTLKDNGYRKALLHYGGKSAEKSGILEKVRKDLQDNGIQIIEVGGVENNIDEVLNTTEAISNILYYYIKGDINE